MTTDNHIQDGTQRFLASMQGILNANERELIPLLARVAADDEPVTIQGLVAATGWEVDEVSAALVKFPQVDCDDRGRITGLFTLCFLVGGVHRRRHDVVRLRQ